MGPCGSSSQPELCHVDCTQLKGSFPTCHAGNRSGRPHFRLPLPLAYESTGNVTRFTNALEPDARSRVVFTFHRPEELIRLATRDHQMRGLLRQMPPLNIQRLWRVQVESVKNLEASL